MDKLINLAENIVKFELIPADKQSNVQGDSDGGTSDKEAGVLSHVDTLSHGGKVIDDVSRTDGNISIEDSGTFANIGDALDNAFLTGKGYLIQHRELTESLQYRELTEPYRFLSDIPEEWRAAEHLDKTILPRAIDIVEQTELSTLALQLHAVCGDYISDAPSNLATLDAMRFLEFLLLIDERGAYLTAANHVYREGTPQYDHFMSAEDSPDTYVFALHVTDIWTGREPSGEPARGPIIGNLASVDLRDQQMDILIHCVKPKMIDGERHFTDEDFASVRRHLERVHEYHFESASWQVKPHELLAEVNLSYMAKAVEFSEMAKAASAVEVTRATGATEPARVTGPVETSKAAESSQGRSIRIPNHVAKEMLARGDADIHLITKLGVEPKHSMESKLGAESKALSQLDVFFMSKYGKEHAFAIKLEDLSGFDKWAKRTATELVRQAKAEERGERKKNRDTAL